MYDSVRTAFSSFTKRFEGRVSWMYLDIKGLVSIGVGNLIDPVSAALRLSFVHKADQSPASSDEISAEWNLLKSQPELAQRGYLACKNITSLELTDSAIDDLVDGKLQTNESYLKQTFTDWDSWPADAQLGVLSMAWAMGPGFPKTWPRFTAACRAKDWAAAGTNCHMDDNGNPGLKPRNQADVLLFANAASVASSGLDASILYYPNQATASANTGTTQSTSAEIPVDAGASESSGDASVSTADSGSIAAEDAASM